jgi:hypothetical protein
MTEEKKNKESGRKWDGRSRISTEQYKKNYNKIFRTHCVICGRTPKPDEWSSQVENACFDCV